MKSLPWFASLFSLFFSLLEGMALGDECEKKRCANDGGGDDQESPEYEFVEVDASTTISSPIATNIGANPLLRGASGNGYDWMDGHILVLSPHLPRWTNYERLVRMWFDIYNHQDFARLRDFISTHFSPDIIISSQFCHHPSKPNIDPLRFFFHNNVLHGIEDILGQYHAITSLMSDFYCQPGEMKIKSMSSTSTVCITPYTFRGTIVLKLPLSTDLLSRLSSDSSMLYSNHLDTAQELKVIFNHLGCFKYYFRKPSSDNESGTINPTPIADSFLDPPTNPLGSWDITSNIYSSLISTGRHSEVSLHTVAMAVDVQGIAHISFNPVIQKVVQINMVYYDHS